MTASSDAGFEGRLSRLEGAYEQVADRLNGIDLGINELRKEMNQHLDRIDQRFASIDQRFVSIDQRFNWVIGLIVTSWTTTILAVLLHHG